MADDILAISSEVSMAAIEIPDELASQIEHAAQRAGQSRSAFLTDAVSSYMEDLEVFKHQEFGPASLSTETIGKLKESLKQLDRGETVSSEEMEAYFDEWEQEATTH